MSRDRRQAIVIGAGPAGLTLAHELLERTDVHPIVLEASDFMGGIARTVEHRGNRIDIGGHRFFSKSDRVMDWWLDKMPLQEVDAERAEITYQQKSRTLEVPEVTADPERDDLVMLLRRRRSRIYYLRRFFSYPISLDFGTLRALGPRRSIKIGLSYLRSVVAPIRDERNLEDFLVNRFGRELYRTFFKSYTEKVWGTSCRDISPEWGAQRIKGLSIKKALQHFAGSAFRALRRSGGLGGRDSRGRDARDDVAQKTTETSLIERFLYPKLGPGQMWEEVARRVRARGGEIHEHQRVERLRFDPEDPRRVVAVEAIDPRTGERTTYEGDLFYSTMPVRELVRGLAVEVPAEIREISEGLIYRDFLTVGLLVDELEIKEPRREGPRRPRLRRSRGPRPRDLIRDNWIYIQEPEVQVGRLQIFNNWSPFMVADPENTVWLGLEYFCNESDQLWNLPDEELIEKAARELEEIEIIDRSKVRDQVVLRMPKTYPAYFGTYDRFDELRAWLDRIENLVLLGRNGMHRYNNQDHSMLTAMIAVDNLLEGRRDRANLWAVNTEDDYHEEA